MNVIPIHIESFMKLESLRQNKDFTLTTSYPEHVSEELVIAPFVLIPFIENAFKHLSHDQNQQKWISVHTAIKDNQLEFEVKNSANFDENTGVINDGLYNGLGLKNVQRRLALVYEDNFKLSTNKEADTYTILLQLPLDSVTTLKNVLV